MTPTTSTARTARSAPSAKAAPRLRVVRPTSRAARIRRNRVLAILGASAVVACLFGVVISHVIITQNQFHLERLQERSAEAENRYNELRRDVAELESPDRIVNAAQERLGMQSPSEVKYLAPTRGSSPTTSPRHENEQAAGSDHSWATVKRQLADRP